MATKHNEMMSVFKFDGILTPARFSHGRGGKRPGAGRPRLYDPNDPIAKKLHSRKLIHVRYPLWEKWNNEKKRGNFKNDQALLTHLLERNVLLSQLAPIPNEDVPSKAAYSNLRAELQKGKERPDIGTSIKRTNLNSRLMPGKQKMLDTSGMDTSGGMINVSSDTYCVFEAARQSSFKDDDNFVQYLLYLYDRYGACDTDTEMNSEGENGSLDASFEEEPNTDIKHDTSNNEDRDYEELTIKDEPVDEDSNDMRNTVGQDGQFQNQTTFTNSVNDGCAITTENTQAQAASFVTGVPSSVQPMAYPWMTQLVPPNLMTALPNPSPYAIFPQAVPQVIATSVSGDDLNMPMPPLVRKQNDEKSSKTDAKCWRFKDCTTTYSSEQMLEEEARLQYNLRNKRLVDEALNQNKHGAVQNNDNDSENQGLDLSMKSKDKELKSETQANPEHDAGGEFGHSRMVHYQLTNVSRQTVAEKGSAFCTFFLGNNPYPKHKTVRDLLAHREPPRKSSRRRHEPIPGTLNFKLTKKNGLVSRFGPSFLVNSFQVNSPRTKFERSLVRGKSKLTKDDRSRPILPRQTPSSGNGNAHLQPAENDEISRPQGLQDIQLQTKEWNYDVSEDVTESYEGYSQTMENKPHFRWEVSRKTLKNGSQMQIMTMTMKCDICQKEFKSGSALASHKKVHGSIQPIACELCDYQSNYESNLERHMKKVHGIMQKVCQICGLTVDDLKSHLLTEHMDQAAICELCGKVMSNKGTLRIHLQSVHGKKDFACPYEDCRMRFTMQQLMQRHIQNVHLKIRSYKCDQRGCNKSFATRTCLQKHILCHSTEKHFFCYECRARFRTEWQLKIHRRIHTGEKPIACHLCDYRCRQKASLNWHMKKHQLTEME